MCTYIYYLIIVIIIVIMIANAIYCFLIIFIIIIIYIYIYICICIIIIRNKISAMGTGQTWIFEGDWALWLLLQTEPRFPLVGGGFPMKNP